MDVLKDKNSVTKSYISRYSNFPFYYHSLDNKHIQGLSAQLSTDTPHVVVAVDQSTSLETLSNKYYGRPDYWWIIADFNRIQDPFMPLIPRFSTLKIPSIGSIEFVEEMQR